MPPAHTPSLVLSVPFALHRSSSSEPRGGAGGATAHKGEQRKRGPLRPRAAQGCQCYELDDEEAALQRLVEEGYDVQAYLITPCPARLLARFNAKVELLRSADSILLAAASPVSMQSIQDVFRLCV